MTNFIRKIPRNHFVTHFLYIILTIERNTKHFMLVLPIHLFASDVDRAVGSFSRAVKLADGWNVEPDLIRLNK